MEVKHMTNFVNSDTIPACEIQYVQCLVCRRIDGMCFPLSDTELESNSVFG